MSACACRTAAADGGDAGRQTPSVAARARALASWALPGAIFALVPKCPLCLAGYVALATGVGVSVTTATYLRWSMLAISAGAIVGLATRLTLRVAHQTSRRINRS